MVDRYDAIRALQQVVQPQPSVVLGTVSGAPLLPALPAPAATPAPAAAPSAPPASAL